jgi:hypothetical protein
MTLEELYEEPKDLVPPTESELDEIIKWYEENKRTNWKDDYPNQKRN